MASKGNPIAISVINLKGGVGKTTIAALLGRYAAQSLNLKVLAIDLDPQANLSQALMGEVSYRQFLNDKSPSIVEVFAGYQPPTVGQTATGRLDGQNVVRHPRPNLKIIPSRFDFANNLVKAATPDPQRLARLIAEYFQDEDLILIDCAPTESIFTIAAYHASRYILVPVRPEFFATIGFPLLNDSLQTFRSDNRGHQIDVIGVVVNDATYGGGNDGGPEKKRSIDEIKEESDENKWHVFNNHLGYSRGFPKMMRGDNTYLGNAPSEFAKFAKELFNRPELSGLQS